MKRGLAPGVTVLIAGAALMAVVTGCGTKVARSTDGLGTSKAAFAATKGTGLFGLDATSADAANQLIKAATSAA